MAGTKLPRNLAALVSVQSLITEGTVDINVLLAVRLTISPELRDLLSDGYCFRIKRAVGVIGNKNITMRMSQTDSGLGSGKMLTIGYFLRDEGRQ